VKKDKKKNEYNRGTVNENQRKEERKSERNETKRKKKRGK